MRDSTLHSPRAAGLEIRLHAPAPWVAVVRLSGDLDLLTAPALRDQLWAQLRTRAHVVVDLEDVTTVGSDGLAVLATACGAAHAAGVQLVLAAGGETVLAPSVRGDGTGAALPISSLSADELADQLVHRPAGPGAAADGRQAVLPRPRSAPPI